MNAYQETSNERIEFDNSAPRIETHNNLHPLNNKVIKVRSKIIQLEESRGEIKSKSENLLVTDREPKITREGSEFLIQNTPETESSTSSSQNSPNLFRLFVKNGEYAYARPNDIIMIESCDHLVKVYIALSDKIKKTIRHNTLKDFLLQLPKDQFMRIGRFCAVNTLRLSGGNCNEQTFEFDFKVSIKLNHSIPQAAFNSIGK